VAQGQSDQILVAIPDHDPNSGFLDLDYDPKNVREFV